MYRLIDAILHASLCMLQRMCGSTVVPQMPPQRLSSHASHYLDLLKLAAQLWHNAGPMVPIMPCLQLVTRIGEVNGKVSAHLSAILPSSLVFSRHLSVVIVLCDLQDSFNALLVLGTHWCSARRVELFASHGFGKLFRRLVETTRQFHRNCADDLTNM